MELNKSIQPAKTVLSGSEILTIPAGKDFKIETSPDGEEILNETVPTGKSWLVRITVDISES